MGASRLGVREFRANWRRNAIFGTILLIAVLTQLITALTDRASREAVSTYGEAVYGYPQTYSASVDHRQDSAGVARMDAVLSRLGATYPWFRAATVVDLPIAVDATGRQEPRTAVQINARAVSPGWRQLSPAIPDDDTWRTVLDDRRNGAALLLESETAARLGVVGPVAVSVFDEVPDDRASTTLGSGTGGDASGTGTGTGAPVGSNTGATGPTRALRNVPVFGTYTELNKSLRADALTNQNLLALLDAPPQQTTLYWRCEPARCADSLGLASTVAAAGGGRLLSPTRIDQLDQFTPVLKQQSRNGRQLAAIVLLLGALAVTIVSTAFIEVRAPQFATLRTLGASRSAIAGIALLENVLTSVVVGVLAVVLGFTLTRMDPNRLNQIQQVRLSSLNLPVTEFGRTLALTLAIGLLTGLWPALRAYRSVRTS